MIIFTLAKINIDKAETDESNLLKNVVEFNNESRPRTIEGKDKKYTYERAYALYEGRELISNAFKSEIFQIKEPQGKALEILTLKQMLKITNSFCTCKSR